MAKACSAACLIIYGDSDLVVQQTMKDYEAVADNMTAYQKLYGILEGEFDGCKLNYFAGANNTEADELDNIGSTRGQVPPGVFLESINQRSIKTKAAHPRQTQTTTTPVSQRRWQLQVHLIAPAVKQSKPHIQQHSKAQPGQNRSSVS